MILSMGVVFASCNGKGAVAQSNEENDTLWNDQIQSVFYDVPFGTSKDSLLAAFKRHHFTPVPELDSDMNMHFMYKGGEFYSFGGMEWELLTVEFLNDKFNLIEFMNCEDDKDAALKQYDIIKKAVSKEYQLEDFDNGDPTVYASCLGYGRDNRKVGVSCFAYEDVDKEMKVGVDLVFMDENLR